MAKFFSRLSYSFGNEDWKTEQQALNIQSNDCVLCITASGDRPLNLLVRECKKMVCVDANPIQNYLFQLKLAAMQTLDYPNYLAFLGVNPSQERSRTLRELTPKMEHAASKFWLKHEKMIKKGVLYQGTVERLTKTFALFACLIQGKKIRHLFSINDLDEQKRFLKEEWNDSFWRRLFCIGLNPWISGFFIKDPGLININSKIHPGTYLYDRIYSSLERELAKKNPLLSLVLQGSVSSDAFSPYLTEEGVQMIKARHHCVEIHTSDVIDYLESIPGPTFDVFSLSDVASYLSYPRFVSLLNHLVRTAKPDARFCMRQFLTAYEIPIHLQPFFVRDKELEAKLEKEDSCFVYRFLVGKMASYVRPGR
jgi:S-adenosylmethionine-diacylglycerol 3-amino-3-carboxypropyl transferase